MEDTELENPEKKDPSEEKVPGEVKVSARFGLPMQPNLSVYQEVLYNGVLLSSRVSDGIKPSALQNYNISYNFPHKETAKLIPYLNAGYMWQSRGADQGGGVAYTDALTVEKIKIFSLGAGVALPDFFVEGSELRVSGNFRNMQLTNSLITMMPGNDAKLNIPGVALNVYAELPIREKGLFAFGSANIPYNFSNNVSSNNNGDIISADVRDLSFLEGQLGFLFKANEAMEFALSVGYLANAGVTWNEDRARDGLNYTHSTTQMQDFKSNMTANFTAKINIVGK